MRGKFPTIVLFLTAGAWAGFAIWLASKPDDLLTAFDMGIATAAMRTEIRAFYGGVEMGIAASMMVLWLRSQRFAAILVGGFPLLGSAMGRSIGMAIDGYSSLHLGLAGLEMTGALLCIAAIVTLPAASSPASSPSDPSS